MSDKTPPEDVTTAKHRESVLYAAAHDRQMLVWFVYRAIEAGVLVRAISAWSDEEQCYMPFTTDGTEVRWPLYTITEPDVTPTEPEDEGAES